MIDYRLCHSPLNLGISASILCYICSRENHPSMADWTKLPEDLLNFIAKRLETPFDIQRFRSICSSWRSSVVPPKRHRPRFPVYPHDGITTISSDFYLSKRRMFLIKSGSTETEPLGWLIKIEEDANFTDKVQILNPLARDRFGALPESFPKVLNLSSLHVFELVQEYVLYQINYPEQSSKCGLENLYMEKAVLLRRDDELNDFMLLTIHVSGKLAIFQSVPKIWTVIDDMPSPYDDVILYKENLYAVDNVGSTVLVGMDLSVRVIAYPIFGGDKKFLVESRGDLIMVDMYLSTDYDIDGDFESVGTVKLKVYKLDGAKREWVEVESLGDQVLFLGDDCKFSLSAKDVCLNRGNCIFFANLCGQYNEFYGKYDIGVFDLENSSTGPVETFPQFSNLFWPPPQWISATESKVSA